MYRFSSSALCRTVIAVAAALLVGTIGVYLAGGDRYLLYTSEPAAQCWRALQLTTPGSSTLEFVNVTTRTLGDGRIEASIGYRMDRVLGGRTLNIVCRFAADSGALDSIAFDGLAPDADLLDEVRRGLED